MKFKLFISLISVVLLASCTGYNSTEIEDKSEGEPRVYGEVDGPPKQLENEYPPLEDGAKKMAAFQEKMFGDTETPSNASTYNTSSYIITEGEVEMEEVSVDSTAVSDSTVVLDSTVVVDEEMTEADSTEE